MSIKIEMEMPSCCSECAFLKNGESEMLYKGVRLGGKCLVLPIKDLDGHTVTYQTVLGTPKQIESEERNEHCPLKECK